MRPTTPLDPEALNRLRYGLGRCPDVAFAYLADVRVTEVSESTDQALFVWLEAPALRSLRSALNTVSEIVSGSLPAKRFLDVVILNSAPELLLDVERAAVLIDESNPEERSRALGAASAEEESAPPTSEDQRGWWPPWRRD